MIFYPVTADYEVALRGTVPTAFDFDRTKISESPVMTHMLSGAVDVPRHVAMEYPMYLKGIAPPIADTDWTAISEPLETTGCLMGSIWLFSGGVVGVSTSRTLSEWSAFYWPESSATEKLFARLEVMRRTPVEERWPGAVWPNAQAFEDAKTFIRSLPLTLIPTPHISLADDGEINFLWKDEEVHIDLGFYGTSTYSYFARGKDKRRIYDENVLASEGLHPEIVALFTTDRSDVVASSPSS